MIFKARVAGRVPSKKNSRIATRSGRNFPSKAYSDWHRSASIALRGAPSFSKCGVFIEIIFPDKRRADVTNKAESVLDLLVDRGIIPDDSWQVIGSPILSHRYEKGDGGFEIIIQGE